MKFKECVYLRGASKRDSAFIISNLNKTCRYFTILNIIEVHVLLAETLAGKWAGPVFAWHPNSRTRFRRLSIWVAEEILRPKETHGKNQVNNKPCHVAACFIPAPVPLGTTAWAWKFHNNDQSAAINMRWVALVCLFQLGQADRFPYNLVNLVWCTYYCTIFRFELNFSRLWLEIYNSNKHIIKD